MGKLFACLILALFLVQATHAQQNDLPGFARWNINHGEYLVETGEYFEALEAFQTAIESTIDPDIRADAYLHKALTLTIYLDAFSDAAKEYEALLTEHSNTAQAEIALFRLAQLYFQQEQYQEATSQFNAYNKRYPRGRFYYQVQILLRKTLSKIDSKPVATPSEVHKPSTPSQEATVAPVDRTLPEKTDEGSKSSITSKLKFDRPSVRVLLIKSISRITIESEASISLKSLTGKGISGGGRGALEIEARNGKVFVRGQPSPVQAFRIESEQPVKIMQKSVRCGGAKSSVPGMYRGILHVSLRGNELQVVNEVDIEDYLYGVVPAEIPGSWPLEALSAQAIAARTYVFYQHQHRSASAFDVHDTPRSQAYHGVQCEFKKSTQAVNLTQGRMLLHENEPILAMYTANTGWHSAHVGHIFERSLPYLVGVEDPFSPNQRHGRWTKTFSLTKVQKMLNEAKLPNKAISRISPKVKTPSGRVIRVDLIYGDDSELLNIRSRTIFRKALKLPEVLFNIIRKDNSLIFEGGGLGHGVGMSQWGAKAMADLNKSHEDILLFYYHDVHLQQAW